LAQGKTFDLVVPGNVLGAKHQFREALFWVAAGRADVIFSFVCTPARATRNAYSPPIPPDIVVGFAELPLLCW
jgi:hypothetical protein